MNHTKQHMAENIKREIAAIVRNLNNPQLEKSLISILKIDIAEKNSSCKVFISSLKGLNYAKNAVKYLNNASGYIRKLIGSKLPLRYIPTITFIATDSLKQGFDIIKKIDNIEQNEKGI